MPYEAKTDWKYDDTVTEKDLNRIEQGIKDAHSAIDRTFLTLPVNQGTNIINTDMASPLTLDIEGQTLTNIFDDAGFNDINKWPTANGTRSFDSTIKLDGERSIKCVAINNDFGPYRDVTNLDASKYYVVIANVYATRNMEANVAVFFHSTFNGVISGAKREIKSNTWGSVVCKFTNMVNRRIAVLGKGVSGDVAYFDGLRLYAVPKNIYDLVNVHPEWSGDKLAENLPFGVGIKHIEGVAITKRGNNLLSPFTDVSWISHPSATQKIIAPYIVQHTMPAAAQCLWTIVKVVPGQTYSLSVSEITEGGRIRVSVNDGRYIYDGTFLGNVYSQVKKSKITIPNGVFEVVVTLMNMPDLPSYPVMLDCVDPIMSVGDVVAPFEPQNDDVVTLPVTLAKVGDVADRVYWRDGAYRKWHAIDVAADGTPTVRPKPIEEIVSTAGLSLHVGGNQVEIETGVVYREPIIFKKAADNYWYSNTSAISFEHTVFKHPVKKIWGIDVGVQPAIFEISTASQSNGLERPKIKDRDYDPKKQYFATYLALDAISASVVNASAQYTTGISGVLSDTVQNVADVQGQNGRQDEWLLLNEAKTANVQFDLEEHTNNKNNPHGVTAAQVGAETPAGAQAKADAAAKKAMDASLPRTGGTINGSLTTSGNIENGGFDFRLGTTDQTSRGNSGGSRALVKRDGSILAVNFSGDFTGGIHLQGPKTVVDNSIIVRGRDVLGELNELKTSGVDAKNKIAGAINAKGVPASADDTFDQLAVRIGQIRTAPEVHILDYNSSRERHVTDSPYSDEVTVVTVSKAEGVLTFSGHIGARNELLSSTDGDWNASDIYIFLEDSNGKRVGIVNAGSFNGRYWYSESQIFSLTASNRTFTYSRQTPTSYDSAMKIVDGKIPDDFNLTGPIKLKVQYKFNTFAGGSTYYVAKITGLIRGTLAAV